MTNKPLASCERVFFPSCLFRCLLFFSFPLADNNWQFHTKSKKNSNKNSHSSNSSGFDKFFLSLFVRLYMVFMWASFYELNINKYTRKYTHPCTRTRTLIWMNRSFVRQTHRRRQWQASKDTDIFPAAIWLLYPNSVRHVSPIITIIIIVIVIVIAVVMKIMLSGSP